VVPFLPIRPVQNSTTSLISFIAGFFIIYFIYQSIKEIKKATIGKYVHFLSHLEALAVFRLPLKKLSALSE
jgi:hypothetical protein